jgi:hypothetical protein
MLCQAYGNDVLNQMVTYKWHKHFKNGRSLTDDEWCGQPSTLRTIILVA